MMKRLILGVFLLGPALIWAELVSEKIDYTFEDKSYEGTLVYDDSIETVRPGVLMVPNWLGPTEASLEKAKKIAGEHYVVFMVDMYGVDVRPQNMQEAGAAAGFVRGDRALMRRRINKAFDVFVAQKDKVSFNTENIGAIGFCFGGGTVLELARSGRKLDGVVSFHGNLDTPNPQDAANIQCKVLVLHGANDPFVPAEQVSAFGDEMRAADVDWQFIAFGGAVHSFTDPYAKMTGKAEFHALANKRSFQAMELFFGEIFE